MKGLENVERSWLCGTFFFLKQGLLAPPSDNAQNKDIGKNSTIFPDVIKVELQQSLCTFWQIWEQTRFCETMAENFASWVKCQFRQFWTSDFSALIASTHSRKKNTRKLIMCRMSNFNEVCIYLLVQNYVAHGTGCLLRRACSPLVLKLFWTSKSIELIRFLQNLSKN